MATLTFGDLSLEDARESLAYWERRARRLPRYALRKRREARAMAVRWRARVAEAERARYGRGVVGALMLLAAEGRLPEPVRHAGRGMLRRAAQAATLVAVAFTAIVVAGAVVVVELLLRLL
jgi:hypothetical protein